MTNAASTVYTYVPVGTVYVPIGPVCVPIGMHGHHFYFKQQILLTKCLMVIIDYEYVIFYVFTS